MDNQFSLLPPPRRDPQVEQTVVARLLLAGLASWMNTLNKNDDSCKAWIVASDPGAVAYLSELSRLAGLEPMSALLHLGPPPPDGGRGEPAEILGEDGDVLILDAGEADFPGELRALPRVTVYLTEGDNAALRGHDVLLPGEEADFLRLLADMAPPTAAAARDGGGVVLVGGWHGGGGSTTAAMSLARASNSILLDAAGNRGGWLTEDGGVGWQDLAVDDLPPSEKLIAALPRSGGVPILGPDTGKPIHPDAEVLSAVLSSLTRRTVVDCGANVDALNALALDVEAMGRPVAVVLVGRSSTQGVRALGQVCAGNVLDRPVTHLLVGRKDRLFLAVAGRYGLRWESLPRARSSRWKKLQGELWAA